MSENACINKEDASHLSWKFLQKTHVLCKEGNSIHFCGSFVYGFFAEIDLFSTNYPLRHSMVVCKEVGIVLKTIL